MQKETRVRYIGPLRSGVPFGRIGTLLASNSTELSLVRWDPYPNYDCQVTHTRCHLSDLEGVTSIPRCERPTRTGTYVIECEGTKALAIVRQKEEGEGLSIHWSIGESNLSEINNRALWWGPIDLLT